MEKKRPAPIEPARGQLGASSELARSRDGDACIGLFFVFAVGPKFHHPSLCVGSQETNWVSKRPNVISLRNILFWMSNAPTEK
jgi:hypothetical protein